jgi:hypothetical protein
MPRCNEACDAEVSGAFEVTDALIEKLEQLYPSAFTHPRALKSGASADGTGPTPD